MTTAASQQTVHAFVLGPFQTNCYVVASPDKGDCWIIDAGFGPEPMIAFIQTAGLTPRGIVLTHAHADHIAGITQLRAVFGQDLPVSIHPAEKDWLTDADKNLSSAIGMPIVADAPDSLLRDGQCLNLGGGSWKVMHTPGHSPGGVTLYCQELATAIVGDTLFAGSIGRFDFPSSDQKALYRSISETLYALPDETRVLPGHGPATTIGQEKSFNPYVRAEMHSHC